jgi:hypothetical protein
MKLIEKFLIKRCSTEVQLMLTRMKERPEDFDYGTGWRMLVDKADESTCPYTKIERRMIRKYWKACEHTRKRNELLARIMQETINPSPNKQEQLEKELSKHYSRSLAASMASTQQAVTSGILSGYSDPRLMYGQIDQNGRIHHPHQNQIQHGLHP